ncbi:hypothetical protein DFJ74DRAFT_683753 [Hyaloraphidium curvatum]|nr:hypothetical protein DFJ74DRAFT_683753 [Hyaloraphidium curvatum]
MGLRRALLAALLGLALCAAPSAAQDSVAAVRGALGDATYSLVWLQLATYAYVNQSKSGISDVSKVLPQKLATLPAIPLPSAKGPLPLPLPADQTLPGVFQLEWGPAYSGANLIYAVSYKTKEAGLTATTEGRAAAIGISTFSTRHSASGRRRLGVHVAICGRAVEHFAPPQCAELHARRCLSSASTRITFVVSLYKHLVGRVPPVTLAAHPAPLTASIPHHPAPVRLLHHPLVVKEDSDGPEGPTRSMQRLGSVDNVLERAADDCARSQIGHDSVLGKNQPAALGGQAFRRPFVHVEV